MKIGIRLINYIVCIIKEEVKHDGKLSTISTDNAMTIMNMGEVAD